MQAQPIPGLPIRCVLSTAVSGPAYSLAPPPPPPRLTVVTPQCELSVMEEYFGRQDQEEISA